MKFSNQIQCKEKSFDHFIRRQKSILEYLTKLFIYFFSRLANVVHFDHFQPNKVRNEVKELRMLCAEDEQSRTCWMTAYRLFKVSSGTPFHWPI